MRNQFEPQAEFSRVSAHCVCESFELTECLSLISRKSHMGGASTKPALYVSSVCYFAL